MMCEEIDEGLIELYALGGLEEAVRELVMHLETCEECKWRVAEARRRAKATKKAQGKSGGFSA
jgi:anti-sigma factor RsiW